MYVVDILVQKQDQTVFVIPDDLHNPVVITIQKTAVADCTVIHDSPPSLVIF
jgi:hypothetical protein